MMRKWRTLAASFFAAAVTLTVVTVTTQSTANANPNNPTFITVPFGNVYQARAFAIGVGGSSFSPLIAPDALCHNWQSKSKAVATASVPGLATAKTLAASCSVNYSGSKASARATTESISLLGGRIKVQLLDSRCSAAYGYATVGSTHGSLVFDQNYSRNGSGEIVIPGIATVSEDVKYVFPGFVGTSYLVVNILPTPYSAALILVIGFCGLSSYSNDG